MRRTGIARGTTPLVASKRLERKTELPRGGGLAGGGGLNRSAPMPRAAPEASRPRPARTRREGDDRGTPIPRWLAELVVERAEGCCDWCGRYCLNGWYSRQHRLARGAGGRSGAHTAANLVLLCGSATSVGCHERCEHSAIPEARAAGFRLRDGEDPETTPILRHGLIRVLPTLDGWVAA